MRRDEILCLLGQHNPVPDDRFGVTKLALFGRFARDAAPADSDVDVLVRFDGPPSSDQYFGAQFYL